jgi:pimeloyl-ACP methyl ester carboxylesterase
MKRRAFFMIMLSLLLSSCQPLTTPQLPTIVPTNTAEVIATSSPTQSIILLPSIEERLKELGGKPCRDAARFTCVPLTVPLDHFDPGNSETIEVVFAVAPAEGERKGMYVQAFPGGPGGEGISLATANPFPSQVRKNYDIVFFDQRGLGLSGPLECKDAYASYFLEYLNSVDSVGEEGYDTPDEQKTAIENAKSFVDQCIQEIGIDSAKLKFFNTAQVAEDIETFRQAIGDDKFMLYGVSYGTSVAQTYARAHSEHLSGLILDGTSNTTLTGHEIAFSQMEAFNMVLLEVFKACDANAECSEGLEGGSQAAYDELAQKLANAPIEYEYRVGGKNVKRLFTFNMLDLTVSFQLYGPEGRMDLMRALASAKAGNMLRLANLYYQNASIDPRTETYLGNPNFSDTMYYMVWCSDDAYYSGTPEERSAKLMEEGQKLVGLIPRLDLDVFVLGLTCPFWPDAPSSPESLEPLKAEGVPTFVLNATLDPATPFHEGKTVFENLDNGYHIYVKGGPHGILGYGFSCPDQYIRNFLLRGTLPEEREIICDWGEGVIRY